VGWQQRHRRRATAVRREKLVAGEAAARCARVCCAERSDGRNEGKCVGHCRVTSSLVHGGSACASGGVGNAGARHESQESGTLGRGCPIKRDVISDVRSICPLLRFSALCPSISWLGFERKRASRLPPCESVSRSSRSSPPLLLPHLYPRVHTS